MHATAVSRSRALGDRETLNTGVADLLDEDYPRITP